MKKNFLYLAIIIVIGFSVYLNILPNGFVWDDEEQIVKNDVLKDWRNLPLAFTSSTFYSGGAGLSGGFYRPLVTLFYFINYQIFGANPFFFHLVQLVFHLLNLSLLYFVLERILDIEAMEKSKEISFLAVLLFAVHPANAEAIAYSACIGEILYLLFGLLAFWFFLDGVNFYSREVEIGPLCIALFLIFLGLLAKETALIFLLIFSLYLFVFVRPKLRGWLKFLFPGAMIVILYSCLRFFIAKVSLIQKHYSLAAETPLAQRLFTIPYEIFSYLRIIFFPRDLAISQHFVVSSLADARFWACFVFLLSVLFAVLYFLLRRRSKTVLFFLFWFLLSLAPILNIIPLDMTIAERWLYFPIIGILAIASFSLVSFKEKLKTPLVLDIIVAVVVLVLSARTVIRNSDWENSLALFGHDINYSQNSYELENNYGVALFRDGETEKAKEHFLRSIELQPKWPYPHNNLGAVYEKENDLVKAEEEYRKSIGLSDYYLAYENMASLLIKMDRTQEAKEFLESSILKFPRNEKMNELFRTVQAETENIE